MLKRKIKIRNWLDEVIHDAEKEMKHYPAWMLTGNKIEENNTSSPPEIRTFNTEDIQ